jgi:uncharacterized membrane protein YqjE
MPPDRIANSDLLRSLGDAFGSLSDLVQKEIRLARAELSEMLASKLQAGTWAVVAAVAALLAAILIVEAAVFALVALGFSTPWACLAIAAVLVIGGVLAFLQARRIARDGPGPRRVLGQVAQDVRTVRELIT